jgi:CRP-like cAMP-binding protein
MSDNSKHRNLILEGLSANDFNIVSSDLKLVTLDKGIVLFEPEQPAEYIYFPTTAVISFLGDTGDGGSIEVWGVGREGVAGIFSIFGRTKPFRGVVQVAGASLVGTGSAFRNHFLKCGGFHDSLLSYYDYLLLQISYLGICNNLHTIEQRFIRWLLMLQDRAGTNELRFTQDAIAGILGTRRATISVAAAALQTAGLIRYTPGSILILSRRELQRIACQCYKQLRGKFGDRRLNHLNRIKGR